MKVDPYVPAQERKRVLWEKVGNLLQMDPQEIAHIFFYVYWHSMEAKDFLRCVEKGKITKETILEHAKEIPARKEKTPEEQQECNAVAESLNESDRQNWELKKIIEIGDEVLGEDNKTFLSGGEYITKGKWYKIQEMMDTGNADFSVITSTNMKGERDWECPWGISVVRRNGQIIWDRWKDTPSAYKPTEA